MVTGTIVKIEKIDDGLLCTIDFGADRSEPAVLYGLSNHDGYPMIDDVVAVDTSGDDNIIVSVFRPLPDGIGTGESITYGRDGSGAIVSSVRCLADGTVIVNDGSRTAAAFQELKSGFDTLKADYNSFLTTVFTPHVHPGVLAGPASTAVTISVAVETQASIDACESTTLVIK